MRAANDWSSDPIPNWREAILMTIPNQKGGDKMFGQKEEEEVKTDPEGAVGVEKGDTFDVTASSDELYKGAEVVMPDVNVGNPVYNTKDNQSLQTIVKSTLEDFYTAIERLKAVTVEIDKVSIGAENWLKSNN